MTFQMRGGIQQPLPDTERSDSYLLDVIEQLDEARYNAYADNRKAGMDRLAALVAAGVIL